MKSFRRLALIVVISLIAVGCSKGGSEEAIVLVPVKVSSNGNWSMLDRNGHILYDDEFKNQPDFAVNGFFSVKEGNLFTLYKVGNSQPEAVAGCDGLISVGYMSEGVIPATFSGGRICLLDRNGKKVCEIGPYDGNEVLECRNRFTEGLLPVCIVDEDNKNLWGYVNTKGEMIIEPKYHTAYNFHDGLAYVSKEQNPTEAYGSLYHGMFIDSTGKEIMEFDNDTSVVPPFYFQNGHILLSEDDSHFIVDKKGEKKKLPSKINEVYSFNGKYVIFPSVDGELGAADIDGNIVIRPKYESLQFGIDDIFLAKKFGLNDYFAIDSHGEVLKELDAYEDIDPIAQFGYFVKNGKKYSLLDKNFKEINDESFSGFKDNWGFTHYYNNVISDYFDSSKVAHDITELIYST